MVSGMALPLYWKARKPNLAIHYNLHNTICSLNLSIIEICHQFSCYDLRIFGVPQKLTKGILNKPISNKQT